MLSVGTYLWRPDPGSKFKVGYTPADVNLLQRMVARHLTVPHQFVCITDADQDAGFDPAVRVVPIDWSTHVPGTCFVRLMTFHPQGREMIGERILQLDLDTVIVGNIDHLVNREEDVVLWRNPTRFPWADLDEDGRKAHVAKSFPMLLPFLGGVDFRQRSIAHVGERGQTTFVVNQLRTYYNTSLLFHRCGTRPDIWSRFDPKRPPAKDDQWYLSDLYRMDCPYFDGARDGVYRLARSDTPNSGVDGALPANACVVTFPGSNGKPSDAHILERNPWVREHRC